MRNLINQYALNISIHWLMFCGFLYPSPEDIFVSCDNKLIFIKKLKTDQA